MGSWIEVTTPVGIGKVPWESGRVEAREGGESWRGLIKFVLSQERKRVFRQHTLRTAETLEWFGMPASESCQ